MAIMSHIHMIQTRKYSSLFEHLLKWGCNLCSENPSCREHQLSCFLASTRITLSSYNFVEAPTSTCTGSNLYKENKQFTLGPPFYPCFSDLKHVQYNIYKNRYNNSNRLCLDMLLNLLMHPGSPHHLCFGYLWKSSESSHSEISTFLTIHA